ncbi:EamA family transporter [Cellulomonas hominis]|uniref:EamA family transporter n=1 Tax=Cellulomonas hominis TaxID=156981 RepID=UPI0027DF1E70|nr:EamA family transporter [Cellulomonas hominis]
MTTGTTAAGTPAADPGAPAPAPAAPVDRRRVLQAMGLIAVGSLGIQTSSALSASLFDSLGSAPVSSLRLVIAALVLLAVLRPRLRGRSRTAWAGVVVYGVAMAAMNLSLYAAIERIPLGVAVTLEFLGPCAVALLASRRVKEGLCAVAALVGVGLISGPGGYFDLAGYAFALSAAVFFALYTVFADKVGKADEGLSGLALSVCVAAVVALPFGVGHVGEVQPGQWGVLAVSAVIGVVIPYSVDTLAGRLTSARVVGTLFSIDPAMGALVALVVLGQSIGAAAVAGIVVVSVAGALLVAISGPRPADPAVPAVPPA